MGVSGGFGCSKYSALSVRFREPQWFQQINAIEKHPLRKLKSIEVVKMFREKELLCSKFVMTEEEIGFWIGVLQLCLHFLCARRAPNK